MTMTGPYSRSVEDYLKAIYSLSEAGDAASTSAIAETLDIQPASVTGMVKKLAESGLLEYLPYRGVRLTKSGVREALRVVRRHRVLETYLCKRLGFSWDDVHGEAERLEHAASDELIEKMAAALEFPLHDPHGAPIPTSSGHIEDTNLLTLADAQPGKHLRIRAVRDEDSADLRSMAAEGLVPGAHVIVAAAQTVTGSVQLKLQNANDRSRSVEVEDELAQQIYVVPDEG